MTARKTILLLIILATISISLHAMKKHSKENCSRFECQRSRESKEYYPTMDIVFHDKNGTIYYLYIHGKNLEKENLGKKQGKNGEYKNGVPKKKYKLLKRAQQHFEKLNTDKATLILIDKSELQKEISNEEN